MSTMLDPGTLAVMVVGIALFGGLVTRRLDKLRDAVGGRRPAADERVDVSSAMGYLVALMACVITSGIDISVSFWGLWLIVAGCIAAATWSGGWPCGS